jgi:predicted RNase H-like HicB family nuclease
MTVYRLSVVIEKDAEGYFAFCPELQGCYTQGDSYEEVLENLKDAIRLHLEDRRENKEEILHPKVLRNILGDADLSVERFKELMR